MEGIDGGSGGGDPDDLEGLIAYLLVIRADIEAGTADPKTIEMWTELQATMRGVLADLAERVKGLHGDKRDRAMQAWHKDFIAEHWSRRH